MMGLRTLRLFAASIMLTIVVAHIYAGPGTSGYLWRASTGGRIRGRPVATRDGVVYLLSEDRHLYALEEHTGRRIWRTFLGSRVWNSICIGADGTVYTVLKNGDLVAVGRGGGIAWKFKARGLPVGNPAAVVDGTVYFTLDTGVLYAVSHTGREKWSIKLEAPPAIGPAVGVNGDIYVGAVDRRVFAFRPWGEKHWNALLAGVPTEPAISRDGTIYYGTDFGSIVALDSSGTILWDYVANNRFLSPVLGKERILAATTHGEVFALNREGEIAWSAAAGERLTGYLTATAGNDLIALSERGHMLRFRDNGELTGRFDVRGSGDMFGVTPKGRYVFGREDWLVYAYSGSLPGNTGWAQPGGDPQHTSSALDRLDSADWLAAFSDDVEFIYLNNLVIDDDRDLKNTALSEISQHIQVEKYLPPYYTYLLSELASEGTLKAVTEYGAVTNDYPGIRGSAAGLLGRIGTLQSADLLVSLLTYEYDSAAQLQMIAALGDLKTDRNGNATAAISQVVRKDLRKRETPDRRLAEAALRALVSIQDYNGIIPHESGEELIFDIYRGAYPKETREFALEVMRKIKR